MAGLDIKIDALVNLRGEITALFVGDPILEHREGVKIGSRGLFDRTGKRNGCRCGQYLCKTE